MKAKKASNTMPDRWFPSRERIAERAYALWMEEGRPESRDLHHWLRAEKELREEHERKGGRHNGATSGDGLNDEDIEADKRVDGLITRPRDSRSPKQERL